MAITIRKIPGALMFGVALALNAFVRAFVDNETTLAHYDITSTAGGDYTAPTSSPLQVVSSSTADLAHVITMAEEIRAVLVVHLSDAIAHKVADTTNLALITLTAVPTATDQATVNTLLNAISTALTAHDSQSGVHAHNDGTNLITAPAATNLATSKALAADARAQTNAHITTAWPSPFLNLVPA